MYIPSAGVISSLKQNTAGLPIDLTADNDRIIPVSRSISKLNVNNTDYSDRKSVTIDVTTSRTKIIFNVWASDTLPAIVATTPIDQMSYAPYFPIQLIKSMDVKYGNYQTQTVTPQAALAFLRKSLQNTDWERLETDFLGGVATKYQEFAGLKDIDTFNTIDKTQNVLKPAYRWLYPIPASILIGGEEKFKYYAAINSPLSFVFNFNSLKSVISKTAQLTIPDLAGTLNIYIEGGVVNDEAIFFNALTYNNIGNSANNAEPDPENFLVFTDNFPDSTIKTFSGNNELKMSVRSNLNSSIEMYIINNQFASANVFYGATCEAAHANFIASMIVPNLNKTSAQTFNFNTGLFVSTGTATSGPWTIAEWGVGKTSFQLIYTANATSTYYTTVNLPVAVDSFGPLYMDLNTYSNNSSQLQPRLFYYDSFTINILPWLAADNTFENSEYTTVTYFGSNILNAGYFTFRAVLGVNTFAFWDVTNIVRAPACSMQLWLASISQPVTSSANTASVFAVQKWASLNLPARSSYILPSNVYSDKAFTLNVNTVDVERSNGTTETLDELTTILMSDPLKVEIAPYLKPQLQLQFDWYNYSKQQYAGGYVDVRDDGMQYITINLNDFPLTFDTNVIIPSMVKQFNSTNSNSLTILMIQYAIRLLKYTQQGTIDTITTSERDDMNTTILDLFVNKGLANPIEMAPPMTSAKKLKTRELTYKRSANGQYLQTGRVNELGPSSQFS